MSLGFIIRKLLEIGLMIIAVLVVLPAFILIALSYGLQTPQDNPIDAVNDYWQLTLPNTQYELLYEEASDFAFFGEGERLLVVQFTADLSQQLAWQPAKEKAIERYFKAVTGSLPVEAAYLPDGDGEMTAKTYETMSDSGSTLKLLYFDALNLNGETRKHVLYIFETMN